RRKCCRSCRGKCRRSCRRECSSSCRRKCRCSRSCWCRRECGCRRWRRRADTYNEIGALFQGGGRIEVKELIGLTRHIEVHAKGAPGGGGLARNEDVVT